jgi:hypothetical protein
MGKPMLSVVDEMIAQNTNTVPGDSKPSKQPIAWPAYKEYPEHITTPQQDHISDGSGIKISDNIDKRQQPWVSLVRANVHKNPIHTLPPKHASQYEVREWLYLVLACSTVSSIADKYPYLVCVTLREWKHTGKALRTMKQEDWNALCPTQWKDTDKNRHYPTEKERCKVGEHIFEVVEALVKSEMEHNEKTGTYGAEVLKSKVSSLLYFFSWRIILTCGYSPVNGPTGLVNSSVSEPRRLWRILGLLHHIQRRYRLMFGNRGRFCPATSITD